MNERNIRAKQVGNRAWQGTKPAAPCPALGACGGVLWCCNLHGFEIDLTGG